MMARNSFVKKILLSCALCVCIAVPVVRASVEREKLAQGIALGVNKQQFWKNWYNPRQRDLLYEPLSPEKCVVYNDQSVGLFFTRASKLQYALKDLLDMDLGQAMIENGLIVKFQDDADAAGLDPIDHEDEYEQATDVKAANSAKAIRGFADQITFQEHKVGFLLTKEWEYGNWFASVRSWLGLAERNYWLDSEFRDGIATLMQDLFPDSTGVFKISDFVSTSFGFGDTHLQVGYAFPYVEYLTLRTGVRCVLPTARNNPHPSTNKLVPLELDKFKDQARTRFNEIVIEPQLGNGGHYGAGVWGDLTFNHTFKDRSKLTWRIYGLVDYLFPTGEERFLMHTQTPIPAGGELTGTDLSNHFQNTSNDADFRSYIHQYVLPKPVTVRVEPGTVSQVGSTMHLRFKRAAVFFGYDWYYKQQENFSRFSNAADTDKYVKRQEAERLDKKQHKLLGGISYNTQGRNVDLGFHRFKRLDSSICLHGVCSVGSRGLGEDFGIGVTAGLNF